MRLDCWCVQGYLKLPLAFALGASAAPAIYLVSATTVTRHAGGRLAPTLSALCDVSEGARASDRATLVNKEQRRAAD